MALLPLAGTAFGFVVLLLKSVLMAPGALPVAPVLVAAGLAIELFPAPLPLLLFGAATLGFALVAAPLAAVPVFTAFPPGMPPLTPVPGRMRTGSPGLAVPPFGSRSEELLEL